MVKSTEPIGDGNDAFFRKTTLAICGNLRIEKAMQECIAVMGERIPVDRMFLQVYEPDLGSMRTMAAATVDEGCELDLLTPMPQAARHVVRQNLSKVVDGAVIIESPERNPVAREMLKFHGLEGSSVLRMTLSTAQGRLGGVVLTAEGPNRYNEDHAELLGLVKKPFTIALFNTLEHREVLKLRDRLADDNRFLQQELHRISGDELVGADFGLRSVMRLVRHVAPTESPVLLTGETGVGKDVVANAIHLGSARRDGPFVAVNCGAIPESLIDSELFGHEKGAFTGALSRKRGRFERAHQGTLFLDEIGEMPLTVQVRLLRVLQHLEIERIGGTQCIPVDIRILAATNKDLKSMVERGQFREDLWFRLNVFPIEIPALRERTQDIPALVQHFLERKAKELKLGVLPLLAPGAIEELTGYSWPGNVRELENVIERAIILHPDSPLTFELGGPSSLSAVRGVPLGSPGDFPSLDTVIAGHIRAALERTRGKIHGPSGAGELLGVNPNTLRARMTKLGIPFTRGAAEAV
jgi:transcriptional regulator with GAF, ATPase, and Fis domain